jgi:zinc D-Ala-D-Ala carboxypeptidase
MPRTKNFSDEELRCSCCDDNLMDEDYLIRLQEVRDKYGAVMHLSSGYRCPIYNAKVSAMGSMNGPHTTGHAVDIKISGKNALRLINIALDCGMQGVGVKQHGEYASRFVHLDDLTDGVRPHIWSYT